VSIPHIYALLRWFSGLILLSCVQRMTGNTNHPISSFNWPETGRAGNGDIAEKNLASITGLRKGMHVRYLKLARMRRFGLQGGFSCD